MSTEIGIPMGDRLELVAGLDYLHDCEEGYVDGDTMRMIKVGIGAVAPVNDRWGVGLRYNF